MSTKMIHFIISDELTTTAKSCWNGSYHWLIIVWEKNNFFYFFLSWNKFIDWPNKLSSRHHLDTTRMQLTAFLKNVGSFTEWETTVDKITFRYRFLSTAHPEQGWNVLILTIIVSTMVDTLSFHVTDCTASQLYHYDRHISQICSRMSKQTFRWILYFLWAVIRLLCFSKSS